MKMIFILMLIASAQAFSYSTLDCSTSQNLTYTSHSKVGGAAPFAGMITHIEEIKKNGEVLYRKVTRESCHSDEFCQNQQPELGNMGVDTSFNFVEDSKRLLSSDFQKETYAIKFLMDQEMWMVCESFSALYP